MTNLTPRLLRKATTGFISLVKVQGAEDSPNAKNVNWKIFPYQTN